MYVQRESFKEPIKTRLNFSLLDEKTKQTLNAAEKEIEQLKVEREEIERQWNAILSIDDELAARQHLRNPTYFNESNNLASKFHALESSTERWESELKTILTLNKLPQEVIENVNVKLKELQDLSSDTKYWGMYHLGIFLGRIVENFNDIDELNEKQQWCEQFQVTAISLSDTIYRAFGHLKSLPPIVNLATQEQTRALHDNWVNYCPQELRDEATFQTVHYDSESNLLKMEKTVHDPWVPITP